MKTRVIDESVMDSATDKEIKRGLCVCFPPDVEVFSKTRAWHGSGPLYSVILEGEESHRIAGHVGVVDRTVRIGDTYIRAAGVQNVYVLPENRGQGICDIVLDVAMKEASVRGFDIGLLFCVPGLVKVYERCGWLTMSTRDVIRVDENGVECPLPGVNVAMFYPLTVVDAPEGTIHLQGNDW